MWKFIATGDWPAFGSKQLLIVAAVCTALVLVGCAYAPGDRVPIEVKVGESIGGYWTCDGVSAEARLQFKTDTGAIWRFVCDGETFTTVPAEITRPTNIDRGANITVTTTQTEPAVVRGYVEIPPSASPGRVRGTVVGQVTLFSEAAVGFRKFYTRQAQVNSPLEFAVK